MCNNNGECRKPAAGVMCPSFRITGNERDVTRGRANALRLAISGQLGPDAFASDAMLEAMKLCVSCKGCRRECPTGVDMAKMKIEVLAAANARRRLSLCDRLVAYLPRYAPYAQRIAPLMNARDAIPGAAWLMERLAGLSARRPLPKWSATPFHLRQPSPSPRLRGEGWGEGQGRAPTSASVAAPHPNPLPMPEEAWGEGIREVALFADTFNAYFEPENLHAAVDVLGRLGYRVTVLQPSDAGRPLCCGRTFLSAGLVDEARAEARRLLAAALPLVERGVPIVGLEPSCLLTLRDEFLSMLPGAETERLASRALLSRFLAGKSPPGAYRRVSPSDRARSCCTAIATRNPSGHGGGERALARAGPGRGDRGVELLRHGRRLRLRRRYLRGVDRDGRAFPAAGRARGPARHHHRGERVLLPPPDP
jgi:Fe-S oxidoreductase